LRGNSATQSAITAFYLHETNAVGVDITNALKIIAAGVKILVQDKTNSANVQYYQTSGPAVDNGAYFTIPVTWSSTGSGTSFTAGRVIFAGFGIGSNNMPEAPTDGSVYGRRGSDTSWQVPPTVRYDAAQSLTDAQQTQARTNIYAAPLDALAYNGMQINGSIAVSQEKTIGTATIVTDGYVCDGWQVAFAGAATASSLVVVGGGFQLYGSNYIRANSVSSIASAAAGDVIQLMHKIEGYRIARLAWGAANAQPIIIGFWSMHSMTGTYSLTVRNSAANRSYAATYTQNVADTLEYKTITIPGCTDGVWAVDNTIGMIVLFPLMCGATRTAPSANTWVTGSFSAAPGQVNAAVSSANFIRIGGVVVLPGTQAPTAAQSPLIMRPYDQELVKCQRYWKFNPPLIGHISETTATTAYFHVEHAIPMRATPTVALVTGANAVGRPGLASYNASAVSATYNNLNGAMVALTMATALINVPANLLANAISFDARL
jgi:hypothetical protein